MQHTTFDAPKMMSSFHPFISRLPWVGKDIQTYDDWCCHTPILNDVKYRENVEQILRDKAYRNCGFSLSSASSGIPKLIPQRLWRSTSPDTYPYQLVEILLKNKIFTADDCVANLFTAGGLSLLYDGCNRLLEGCKSNILPIGRFDLLQKNKKNILKIMRTLSVDTLFGTPGSLVQIINEIRNHNYDVPLKKIVFTGEALCALKREFIKKYYPNIKIYGLYGHSETGFIGYNTPQCFSSHYHILDKHFFIESTEERKILVTDLTSPLIPLIRYSVGDLGILFSDVCSCGDKTSRLYLKGRHDKKFNFMGNLISYSYVKTLIESIYKSDITLQIQLTSNKEGHDYLNIIIDDNELNLANKKSEILSTIRQCEEIEEAFKKKAGGICLWSREKLCFSDRQKIPNVIDMR